MDLNGFLTTILLAILPVSELRGSIPYGIGIAKISPVVVYAISVAANILIIPVVFVFLDYAHKYFLKISIYSKLFNHIVKKARIKGEHYTKKYGFMGLALFVAIPLPITGAYTGTLAAWVIGTNRKRAILALSSGVVIAGIIVTLIVLTGKNAGFLLSHFGY